MIIYMSPHGLSILVRGLKHHVYICDPKSQNSLK